MGNVIIRDNGRQLFWEIKETELDLSSNYCEFGYPENHFVIITSQVGGFIMAVKCYSCNSLIEATLNFPDSKKAYKVAGAAFYPKSYDYDDLEDCGQFQMSFNSKELDVVLLDNYNEHTKTKSNKGYKIATKGRVEYVTGIIEHIDYDDENLLYIRIKDLTPEEYAILKKYKTDRPIEDFAPIAYLPNND